MGYQLVFWQQSESAQAARSVYQALMDDRPVPALRPLPIEAILSQLLEEFPGAVREPNGPDSEWVDWVSDDQRSSFQVEWSDRHVLVECRSVSNEVGNGIIDVFDRFRCPLYDPQVNERFESGSEG